MSALRNIAKKILPDAMLSILASMENYKILSLNYGQYRSMRLQKSVDREGNPIPWYTYPAIDYLTQFDFSKKLFSSLARAARRNSGHPVVRSLFLLKTMQRGTIMLNVCCLNPLITCLQSNPTNTRPRSPTMSTNLI